MLAEANLTNADLRGATLTGATVTNANLSNANLTNVVTGALVGTPIGLPSVFSFEEGVIKFKLVLKPVPRTIGVAKVGQTLTAVPGSWDSGVILSYQWLRNGEEIPGASASKYKLTPLDYRKAISVTGTGTGGVTELNSLWINQSVLEQCLLRLQELLAQLPRQRQLPPALQPG
jgi:uncharacterized protein YjbI with pentapeptide repeats